MNCPSELNYSYPWGAAYTAYSTNLFDFSGSLQVTLTFLNKHGDTLSLSTPQVWTTDGLPPDLTGDFGSPIFQLINTPQEVKPDEEFVIQGVADLSSVKSGNRYLTFRPQISGGGWFGDIERWAPVVSAVFICLPEKVETKDINSKVI
ncbi:hypothetical protein [Photorhabdus laumondii]|uniref:Uncharacterized protein n=1 Tax=Photorhabdus laumondii subsp. clarkei TaxID=2029685 RepID=A0A329VEN8_9GAMM|nr:hypothetical protein [Photorhabdus laumondii]PQQ35921.1 hypothetical protein C6H68_22375 [Photorhabdus luminescens]RAW86138.1 hypothetical protein CKY01_18485 [Photorhabdus laumondii subsp. clarkei]